MQPKENDVIEWDRWISPPLFVEFSSTRLVAVVLLLFDLLFWVRLNDVGENGVVTLLNSSNVWEFVSICSRFEGKPQDQRPSGDLPTVGWLRGRHDDWRFRS